MPEDSDPADGAHDVEQLLDEALEETAILQDESSADVLVLPVEGLPPPSEEGEHQFETLQAILETMLEDRSERVEALASTVERQQALLVDLTARVGDLEARLEGLAAERD